MGIASLVLGIVSLVIGFVPFCGIIALVPAVIGLILGIIDIAKKSREGTPKGQAITGLTLSSVAIMIIIFWTIIVSGGEAETNSDLYNEYIGNKQIQEQQVEEQKEDNVPTEYKNALKKAELYSETMHMSKQAIYDQLTSEYGEQFQEDAAQYAIDNMEADWKANALEKAKTYQETMNMSKNAIYDQLISEYGEQFTEEEAQYAIEHLED